MQSLQVIQAFAKKLVELSFDGDFVSQERVEAILEALRQAPPRNPRTLLKSYLTKLRVAMRNTEGRFECYGDVSSATFESLKKQLVKHYNHNIRLVLQENPNLLAGFKIFIGDDVWDASVSGRLEQLSHSFQLF